MRIKSDQQLTPDESEAYLSLAPANWLLQQHPSSDGRVVSEKLAASLAATHHDEWLRDFIISPPSPKANRLLLNAINANYRGDADGAGKAATAAETEFKRVGNRAGVVRSQMEQVYSRRRSADARACQTIASRLEQALRSAQYPWIDAQNKIEHSSCAVMATSHDLSRTLDREAEATAKRARYGILQLRALALQGNLDLYAGRVENTWTEDEEGLRLFWQGVYPDERAFQFYHDLEFSAEVESKVHLALLLQKETLSMIEGHGRTDFEAMAHLRMAEAEETLGASREAQNELSAYQDLIGQLPRSSMARNFYESYSEIVLAKLELRLGHQSEAATYLQKAAPFAEASKNAILRLDYLQARAELDRASSSVASEIEDLKAITALVERELISTMSLWDRWHMRRTLEGSQRRLLEIALSEPHEPLDTFSSWHFWRTIYSDETPKNIPLTPRSWAIRQLGALKSRTLVSFAVLPRSVVVWTLLDDVLQEKILPLEETRLRKEVIRFYELCSDPGSDLEEVKASGSRLYEMLIAPLELRMNREKELFINADSFLSFVPWAALRTADGQYWGLEESIVVHTGFMGKTPNTSEQKKRGLIRRILAVAPGAVKAGSSNLPALPSAEEEVRFIHALYPEGRVLTPGTAISSRVRSHLRHTDAFHFAGHAIDREDGGELLTDESESSSMLSAFALHQTAMPQLKLVVLSACASAAPGPDADRRPEGLVQAFIEQGVPMVIASRWDVDSSATAGMMRDFYSSLKAGSEPEQALRGAEQDLARNKAYAHPYYWAGFQEFTGN